MHVFLVNKEMLKINVSKMNCSTKAIRSHGTGRIQDCA